MFPDLISELETTSDLFCHILVDTFVQASLDAVNHTLRGLRQEYKRAFAAGDAAGTKDKILEAWLLILDA